MDFVADKAHEYRNESDQPMRLFMVVLMPTGEWDRRERGGAE